MVRDLLEVLPYGRSLPFRRVDEKWEETRGSKRKREDKPVVIPPVSGLAGPLGPQNGLVPLRVSQSHSQGRGWEPDETGPESTRLEKERTY